MVVYIPPNNKDIARLIQQKVIEWYMNRPPTVQYIIMEDFNSIINQSLDKSNPNLAHNIKLLPLHRWLLNQDFTDTFRFLNPDKIEFTWSNSNSASRIDQIWVSEDLIAGLR